MLKSVTVMDKHEHTIREMFKGQVTRATQTCWKSLKNAGLRRFEYDNSSVSDVSANGTD